MTSTSNTSSLYPGGPIPSIDAKLPIVTGVTRLGMEMIQIARSIAASPISPKSPKSPSSPTDDLDLEPYQDGMEFLDDPNHPDWDDLICDSHCEDEVDIDPESEVTETRSVVNLADVMSSMMDRLSSVAI
jgi:hypothetical protein